MKPWNKLDIDEFTVAAMFNDGKTAVEIAAHFGCSKEPVRRVLRKIGLRRPAKRRAGVGRGAGNPAWKGGRRIRTDGYVAVWTPDGERLEHQVAMERHLGRKLLPGEVVHHRDRNKQNNDVANLELTTQREHAREHAPEMHRARHGR